MIAKITIWFLLVSLAVDISASPVQFPGESSQERSVAPYEQHPSIEPKFHHGHFSHKHKKKKKRKRKKGCSFGLNNRYRYASGQEQPEGRFFFPPLINYYDTDINVYNGLLGGGGGNVDPCTTLIGGGENLINTGGSLISGAGSIISGLGGVVPRPPTSGGGGITPSPGGGDDGDDDYDYSDGGDSSNPSGGSNLLSTGAGTLGSIASNAPGAVSNVLSNIGNGIRPIFERPERYFDYYVVRPFNRSVSQLLRWF